MFKKKKKKSFIQLNVHGVPTLCQIPLPMRDTEMNQKVLSHAPLGEAENKQVSTMCSILVSVECLVEK